MQAADLLSFSPRAPPFLRVTWTGFVAITHDIVCELCIENIFVSLGMFTPSTGFMLFSSSRCPLCMYKCTTLLNSRFRNWGQMDAELNQIKEALLTNSLAY